MQYRIGIDLGGTAIKAGIVDETYQVICSHQQPTVEGFELVVADMAETARIAAEKAGLRLDDFPSVGRRFAQLYQSLHGTSRLFK